MPPFSLPSPTTTPSRTSTSSEVSTLPFPPDLPRASFLTPAFHPETYLSTLSTRHQTLSDLHADLRARSQLLNQELLDLVDSNYTEILHLGSALTGGEDKVEGVRVGLLGFEREVEGVRVEVRERAGEVGALVREKRGLRGEVVRGRALLEVEGNLAELERVLGLTADDDADGEEGGGVELSDSEDDDTEPLTPNATAIAKLERHTTAYLLLTLSIARLAPHPFLSAQSPRVAEVRKTLLLDLAAALRRAKLAKEGDEILRVVRMYGELGAEAEALRVVRGS
ncbi:hypothetical protein LTR08_006111 [Meristemomyces frigidus]|nr:hypothetical protein LTR08_006111 [Meristemomyces frigidus]